MAEVDKIILKNKPVNDANGQYNYGNLGDGYTILGIDSTGIFANNETELYTTVEGIGPEIQSGGVMWISEGTGIEITSLIIKSNKIDTDESGSPNHYWNAKVAMYIFDSAKTPGIIGAGGNQMRDLIGEGNSFGESPHLIAYWDMGKTLENADLGDVVQSGPWDNEDLSVLDFPAKAYGTSATFDGSAVFDQNMVNWTKNLTGQEESYIYIVIRVAGDEREYSPFGHGWLNLSGGYRIDERDRTYVKLKIPKKDLFEYWSQANGEEFIIDFPSVGNLSDNYGDYKGHSPSWLFNDTGRCYDVVSAQLKIKAPLWTPEKALTNNNSMWLNWIPGDTDASEQPYTWYHPDYALDYYSFPGTFYNNEEGSPYFRTGKISNLDFRPISEFSSSFNDIDVQTYYPKYAPEHQQISAPMTFRLKFKIGEPGDSYIIKYKDINPADDIKYGFFVDNWEWEPGQKSDFLEVVDSMPQTGEEIDGRRALMDEYEFKQIGGENDYIEHMYTTPGLKIIKAVIISYVESGRPGYENHKQVLWWKVATVRGNVTRDSTLFADFGETGGDDFVFFPYPETYRYPSGCVRDECEIIGSHPIISGMSNESEYVTSIRTIQKSNLFSEDEGSDKLQTEIAYEHTGKGDWKDFGNYIGESNIGQIRYLNRPYRISTLLNVDILDEMNNELHLHSDESYWTGDDWYLDDSNFTFSKESLATALFISEYPVFSDYCLVELNCDDVSGTSIRDSSGNGNKGILIGDYSVVKEEMHRPVIRESQMKVPKVGKSNKAF
tara:strand:- start:589 stop:2916 length:2328 start_codon:yes stop_codon:yes gene_type:complete